MAKPASDGQILLFGGSGQLGLTLASTLRSLGPVRILHRADADLLDVQALRDSIRHARPSIVINAAAYTAVDRAESEPKMAMAVNAVAPSVMAEETQRLGASMIHYSTDFVFDGERRHPYTESSITNPISVYGRSKLEGEQAVAKMCHRHVVLRTSWLFSQHGHNFLKTILRLASERDELRVVADQEGSPTSTELVAAVTLRVAKALRVADTDDRRWGLYHVAATGHTTWYEYARYAIEKARESGAAIRVAPDRIRPIGAAEYAAPASRPAYSVLDSSKLVRVFDMDLMDWQEGVDRVLPDIAGN